MNELRTLAVFKVQKIAALYPPEETAEAVALEKRKSRKSDAEHSIK